LDAFAVMGMFFVSGAVLEYNYQAIRNFTKYTGFVLKRFFRLYPIYWVSLLLSGMILLAFSGVFPVSGDLMIIPGIFGIGYNSLNWIGWFIGAIFSLYLLFPFISATFRKYPYFSLIACAMIEITFHMVTPSTFIARSIPLWNLFEFGLGIFCIQMEFYPRIDLDSPLTSKIADFSFYVFIFHIVVLQYMNDLIYLLYSLGHSINSSINIIFFGALDILGDPIAGYIGRLILILIVSFIAMLIDKGIQKIVARCLIRSDS